MTIISLLHPDDACFGGEEVHYDDVIKPALPKFIIEKTKEGEFNFLGRHVTQNPDFSIEVVMDKYLKQVNQVMVPTARRKQPS